MTALTDLDEARAFGEQFARDYTHPKGKRARVFEDVVRAAYTAADHAGITGDARTCVGLGAMTEAVELGYRCPTPRY